MPTTGLVPNVGEARMVGLITNQSSGQAVVLRLYKNNLTPASTDVRADYTDATFTGYSPITTSSSGWEVLGDSAYIARYTLGTAFTCSATTSENIYGFFLTSADSSVLLWAERFDEAPKTISFSGDAITAAPAIIITRTGTALDVLTGLVASWPLTESSGTRYDLVGGYHLSPWFEDGVTSTTSTASTPAGTVARFTQHYTATSSDAVADVTFSGTSGFNTVISSTSASLPVFTAGQHFQIWEHSVVANYGMYVATGTPSSSSLSCTKTTEYTTTAPVDSPAEAAKFRTVSFLYRGTRAAGYGFSGGVGSFGQINIDGSLGISLTYWVKVRTGAIVGQTFFATGATFISTLSVGDANSTPDRQSFSVANDGGGSSNVGLTLPAYDTWYFIASVYDPVTGKPSISRDGGTPVVGTTMVGAAGHPVVGVGYKAGYMVLGGYPQNAFYTKADMSQVNLWNKVITRAEIEYLMTKRPL